MDCTSWTKKHNYYYQVQGQLLISGRKMAKFVVYTTVDMKVIDIPVDLKFQKNMTRQLETFFENHFKPAYLDLHFFRSYSKYTFDD